MRWLPLLSIVLFTPRLAVAADPEAQGGTDIAYDHKGQIGGHIQLGTGYRVLFPYEATPKVYCGQTDDNSPDPREVCTGRSPFFMEVGASYGVTSAIELLADVRLGVEKDFTPQLGGSAPRAFVLAPGAKIYIDEEGSTKFFSTLQAAFDLTNFEKSGADASVDVAIRNVNGLQIDFHKAFGVYFHFGETIGFVRWLRFELDAGIGIQGRYP